jgi:hypothetical protein
LYIGSLDETKGSLCEIAKFIIKENLLQDPTPEEQDLITGDVHYTDILSVLRSISSFSDCVRLALDHRKENFVRKQNEKPSNSFGDV